MNDSKTRSKLWRAKQKQETPNFVSKERERHRLFHMKKKQQLGGGYFTASVYDVGCWAYRQW